MFIYYMSDGYTLLPHLHLYYFASPWIILKRLVRSHLYTYCLPQTLHVYFTLSWICFLCIYNCAWTLYFLSHILHRKVFSLVWTTACLLRFVLYLNPFLHTWQAGVLSWPPPEILRVRLSLRIAVLRFSSLLFWSCFLKSSFSVKSWLFILLGYDTFFTVVFNVQVITLQAQSNFNFELACSIPSWIPNKKLLKEISFYWSHKKILFQSQNKSCTSRNLDIQDDRPVDTNYPSP